MEVFINAVLLTLLVAITLAIIFERNLFAVILLAGAYSFLIASVLIVLDAVDVAMTEAAVGAGISTVILLATLNLTRSREYARPKVALIPLLGTLVTAGALIWGTWALPPFGVAAAPIHQRTTPQYIAAANAHEIAPNIVTAVLADYRGYDTLGETTVIFTAGIGVMMLLRGKRGKASKAGGGRDAG